jgi:AsmA protein
MNNLLRTLLIIIAGMVGFFLLVSVALVLFFDPNEYRDEISAVVKDSTGRDLTIEGDLSLSLFPWLAIEVGRTELGNAEGFGDEPLMRFDEASLSIRLLPLILSRETSIGTASIEGLIVNLSVAADGSTNWDDFMNPRDVAPVEIPESEFEDATKVEFGSIVVSNANVSYSDAQAGSAYSISNLQFESDGIGPGDPFDLEGEFDFTAQPGDLSGHVAIRGTTTMTEGAAQMTVEGLNVSGELRGMTAQPALFNFDSREMTIDTAAEILSPGEMDLSVLGVSLSAKVEPFSYAGSPQPKAELHVAEFSLKDLMRALDMEPPATADPNALGRVAFNAKAAVTEEVIALESMTLDLDDSTMVGTLSLPLSATGAIRFDLNVGAINLDGYMAPPAAAAPEDDESQDDFEIPVDVIRELNANGSLKIGRAFLSGLEFTNLELGVDSSGGKLRLHPLAAELYDGTYDGDVRIDASQDVPSISVNENLSGVNLNSLAKSMFEQDNISGTVNAKIILQGAGRNLAAIRQDLDGNMSLELKDGAWEGTDVWHQLRTARAMFRQEPPPEPALPARTQFTSVSATGMVTDGIFENNDLEVLLPFLQLTGKGFVDLPAGHVDYSVEARVLDKPELMAGVSEAELADFTKTVVPVRISGPLNAPSVRPDIEAVFRQQVEGALEEQKEELKNRLFESILGGDEPPAGEGEAETEEAEEEDLEEQLKKKLLKDLIGR